MVALKFFQLVRKSCQIMGILPSDPNSHPSFSLITLLLLLFTLIISISSTIFLLYKAQSIQEHRDSFLIGSSSFVCAANFSVIIWKMPSYLQMIDKFEEFIQKKSQNSIRMAAYRKLNADIERLSEMYILISTRFSVPGSILPPLISTILNYFVYNLDDESYLLPSPIALPFNWKTPFGYLTALMVETMASICMACMGGPSVGIFIGSCWLLTAFLKDITNDLTNLSVDAKLKRNEEKLNAQFCDIVLDYSDTKQMAEDFSVNSKFIITILFLWMLSLVCNSLFILEIITADDTENALDVMKICFSLFVCCSFLALFCEFGEMITEQFEMFNDELSQCKWYLFSTDVQQMFVILMAFAQKPMNICGCGKIKCTRESFKKTINSGFSYFMALRRIHK